MNRARISEKKRAQASRSLACTLILRGGIWKSDQNQDQKEKNVIIKYDFDHESLSNHLKIELNFQEERWSKQYFLNDKKIQQQQLLKIFQLFWFTETDKVFFIKDTQYQRNTINRIACYFEPSLFQLLNKFTKLRREKKKVLQQRKRNPGWSP